jgi:hypothetical protein
MSADPKLSPRELFDVATAIRDRVPPEKVAEELLRIATSATNAMARLGALRTLAEFGWGKAKAHVTIEHKSEKEARKVYDLLAQRAPELLREIAGWNDEPQVIDCAVVRALPAGEGGIP